jgi:hypothetical protein
MKVVEDKISPAKLKELAKEKYGNLIKAVVDVEKKIMVVSAELHADEEALLLEKGSRQENLWGINLYPDKKGEEWIEFDSMINLRPVMNNMSRGVDDPKLKKKITGIVNSLVQR